ncbi:MAG: PIN domain-containing protein [Candidatus Cloacimonetes bacterium]|nr:PIN domain-containing protein [Candidatus Cloacimonadota bacterium]
MENLKKVVVDTNILVEYLRASNISKKEQTILFHLFLKGYKVYTTAINVIEIYAGAKEEKEKLEIKKLLNFLEILPLENTILRKIGEHSFKLRKENKNVGMADLGGVIK